MIILLRFILPQSRNKITEMTSSGSTRSMCFWIIWLKKKCRRHPSCLIGPLMWGVVICLLKRRTCSLVFKDFFFFYIPLLVQTWIFLHRGRSVYGQPQCSAPKKELLWNSSNFQCPLKEWPRPWELHTVVASVLTRLKALRTTVQFKDVSEKAYIQAEAADINIPDVIPGQARCREIPAKLKALFHIGDWRLSATESGGALPSQPVLSSLSYAHIQELQRHFEGKGKFAKIKTDNSLPDRSVKVGCWRWASH